MMPENVTEADVIETRTLLLYCTLTMGEIAERQVLLVDATQKRDELERALIAWKGAKKEEEKEYEAEIKTAASTALRMANIVESGRELRDVEVNDLLADSSVTVVRTDTGEILSQRPATPEEMQRPLPMEPPPEEEPPVPPEAPDA